MKTRPKTIFLFILFFGFLFQFQESSGQDISCQEEYEIITENYDNRDVVNALLSYLLAKVTYYTLDDQGFVVPILRGMNMAFRVSLIFFVVYLAKGGQSLSQKACLALGENHSMPILGNTPVIAPETA